VKIFVSYSREDAGDFAERIHKRLGVEHDVFIDANDIKVGSVWTNVIEDNISSCDLFIVVLTHAALTSSEVEKEVLQAQRENKKIIPCTHRSILFRSIEYARSNWGLEKIQGIEFNKEEDLARELYLRIEQIQGAGERLT
jgi:hypothetical protein